MIKKRWSLKFGIPMVIIGILSFTKEPDAIMPIKFFLILVILVGIGLIIYNYIKPKTPKEQAEEWYDKGLVHGMKKNFSEAIQCFNKAIDIHPEYVDAIAMKGGMLIDSGKASEAIECLNMALELNPKHKSSIKLKKAADEVINKKTSE